MNFVENDQFKLEEKSSGEIGALEIHAIAPTKLNHPHPTLRAVVDAVPPIFRSDHCSTLDAQLEKK